MAEYRLKIRIGDHEFEAEGPAEAVKSQFDSFKELIAAMPIHKLENSPESGAPSDPPLTAANRIAAPQMDRIFRADKRIVSLTAPPDSETDAVLLILYGQKFYRNNESPTGSEILDGMEQSGYRAIRTDRILAGLEAEGSVIITGAHRGKRYRLTNQGNKRAEDVVRASLAKLP